VIINKTTTGKVKYISKNKLDRFCLHYSMRSLLTHSNRHSSPIIFWQWLLALPIFNIYKWFILGQFWSCQKSVQNLYFVIDKKIQFVKYWVHFGDRVISTIFYHKPKQLSAQLFVSCQITI